MKVAVEIRIMKADDLNLFDNDLGPLAHFVEEDLDRGEPCFYVNYDKQWACGCFRFHDLIVIVNDESISLFKFLCCDIE